jgi:putative nucleotidyltransferase with HDIG domain
MSDLFNKRLDDYIKSIPSLSTTVSKVLEICNNPQTSPADLNHVISLDPVLVGRVLKLINSAYYGLDQRITSLVRAIIMLGINTVKNLALSSAIMGNFKSKEFQGLDANQYWRHSLCVGVTAKHMAKERGIDPKLHEEYFTAGLLHDIGKIPLNAVFPKDYLHAILTADSKKVPLLRIEERNLGITHNEVGGMVVSAWKIEGALKDAVIHHHDYDEYTGEHSDVLYSVVVANYFAALTETGYSGDRYPEVPGPAIWRTLGVKWEHLEEIKSIVDEEISKAQVFLNL